jgi:hypothetical protein
LTHKICHDQGKNNMIVTVQEIKTCI